jgi:dienelactone hydrolase
MTKINNDGLNRSALWAFICFSVLWAISSCSPSGPEIQLSKDLVYASPNDGASSDPQLDVYALPEGEARPVIVVLHGGASSKEDPVFVELSERLAAENLVVFNPTYLAGTVTPDTLTADDGLRMRAAFEHVVCAVRFASDQAVSFGGDPANITIVGHSAGGFFGLISAMAGPDLSAAWDQLAASRGAPDPQVTCTAPDATSHVKAFVGFNGAYFIFETVGSLSQDVELKALTNPHLYVGGNPGLQVQFIYGSQDTTQPPWHLDAITQFVDLLRGSGYAADWTGVDAGHGFEFEGPAWDTTLELILSTAQD